MSSVLIVDDEKHVRDYVYDVLSDRYSCDVATNADEAIRILETGSYEIVITDISMPGISGLELFGYIRETRPDIPVIVISGISDLDYVKGLIQMGVFHYMMKPFGPSELEAAVENAFTHLGKLKKEREIQFTDSWSTEGTEQNLLEIERRWVEAYRRRDNAVLLEIWAPDFVLTNSFGEIMPRNQAIASVSS